MKCGFYGAKEGFRDDTISNDITGDFGIAHVNRKRVLTECNKSDFLDGYYILYQMTKNRYQLIWQYDSSKRPYT